MFLDRSLTNATAITPATGSSLTISDAVAANNPADVFKFSLQQNSSLNLLASRLSGDVNIAIVQDKIVDNKVTNLDEVLFQSANAGLLAEQLKVSTLLPGNYFIVVELGANTAADYTIEVGATKSTNADILWRDFSKNQVGYWRFDGLQYMDTRTVTSAMDAGWRFEAIGDFDGDRAEDILWRHSATDELVVWLLDPETATIKTGSGYIKQTATSNYKIGSEFRVAGVGDTDGDGKGDIIWRNELAQTTVIWYMNGSQFVNGGAVRLASQTTPWLNDASWELVDTVQINDDKKFDIVWRNRTSNQVVNWIMDGNVITSGGTTSQRLGAAYDIESVGDFNGDGRGDLLWRDTQGNVQMWLVNAQANNYDIQTVKLWNGTAVPTVGLEYKLVGVEDFSGDGKADIVWRHQAPNQPPTQTGFLVLWTMDGATITQQSQTVSNTNVNNLSRQTLGTASKADFVDFGVQLSAATDTGSSQSDWITRERRSALSGVAEAGSQVSLFANNALIGTTTATTAGTWSILGNALDDGVYTLSTQIKTTTGYTMTQTIGRQLTIDGTAPDTQITGPIDGVGWDTEIELAGKLLDLDPEAKVEYSVNADGTFAFGAVMAATLENPTTSTLRQKTIAPTKINLGPITGTQLFKPYDVTLTSTDRAGNVTTQTYKGMRLNLPPLTEDSILLPNSLMPTLPDTRTSSNTNNLNNPSNTGGYLFIGSGGGWGYGTTGGTGAGGWNWNPIATNPAPAGPPQLVNPDEKIGYLPALRLALTTARDVLSNHPATVSKKEALKQQLEMLMAVGEVVDTNGFYEAMRPMLQGVFATANATGGITRRQAVLNGWEFAKALAISPTLTGLQIFQADLYAVGLAALKQTGFGSTAVTQLKGAIEGLSTSYARLRPTPNGDETYENYNYGDFLGDLWVNGKAFYLRRSRSVTALADTTMVKSDEQSSVARAITDLVGRFQGQADPIKALRLLDRTIQSATQVRQLHEDSYLWKLGYYSPSYTQRSSSVRDTGFLANLANLSFEIARTNPTVTAGANPTSEWIETLWEGGNTQSAAGGLSDWFSGFGAEAVDIRRDQMVQALTYAGRLVNAAKVEGSTSLSNMTKESSFVNHLVDLAGSYTRYRLVASPTNSNFYLDNLWSSSNSEQNTALMTNYWQQMGEGNSDSGASQSTFQFLYSLEFAQSGNKKGQILAKTVRNGFSNYGKFQTTPRGGNDDPTIRADDIKNVNGRYANIQGSLFAYGANDSVEIAYNDAIQGGLSDCYLMAAMAAVALHRPQVIRSMFHDNGNGTYDVTFFDPLSLSLNNPYKKVTVDADLPIYDDINNTKPLLYGKSADKTTSGYELWPSLLEKAYALAFGGKSYTGIEQNVAGSMSSFAVEK
jgi:Bacterial Ig-like domain/Calpain family cysteine protease